MEFRYIKMLATMKSDITLDEMVDKDMELNYWLGSTLKGALINKLKRNYCKEKGFNCSTCNRGMTCPIQAMFNTKNIQAKGNAANPIILNTDIKPDRLNTNEFKLSITLIEHGIMYKEDIERVLRQGINFRLNHNEVVFSATNVVFLDEKSNIQLEPIMIKYNTDLIPDNNIKALKISIESPLKIQDSAASLSFDQLLRVMMTRVDSVGILSNQSKTYDLEIIEHSKSIKTAINNTHTVEMCRKSSNHDYKLTKIKCLVGYIVYTGDLTPYINIIKVAEQLNIGKWTTMGLGRIKVETL